MTVREDVPFRASPFSLLADASSAACWAGRKQTLSQLKRLIAAWANRADSSLDIMWANLGAGKTHALLHVKYLLSIGDRGGEPIVSFVDMPEDIGNFRELYAKIMPTLPLSVFADLCAKYEGQVSMRLKRAFRAIAYGSEAERRLASDWIVGGRPPLRELKAITGIDSRIESDSDAEAILVELVQLAASNRQRFVILLDEFQRLSHLGKKKQDALLSHTRSLFSRNATHLSVVLAVASRVEKTAIDLLPGELRTIIGMRPSISLPQMNKEEAKDFVLGRFKWYRPEGYSGAHEYPFSSKQIDLVISYLIDEAKAPLIPRSILQVLGIVYDHFMTEGKLECTEDEFKEFLESLRWDDA